MEGDAATVLVELTRQIGRLRQDLSANAGDWETYQARVARIDRMIATLAASFVATQPALADAIVAASQTPERVAAADVNREEMRALPAAAIEKLLAAIEKVGLLRRDMQHRRELDRHQDRMTQISDRVAALAERLSTDDPAAAKALTTAWQLPARSLAFRNAAHQKKNL
jgi:chromosome segregation ATPase